MPLRQKKGSMWFLYLDESGDLGFDLVNKKASKFFTITILAINGKDKNRALIKAAEKTLKRKLNNRRNRKRSVKELKGAETTIEVKKYLFDQLQEIQFGLYSVTLNKRSVYEKLTREKSRVYNHVAKIVLEQIPFEEAPRRVYFTIDRSKSKPEINEFNKYIIGELEGRLDPKVPLNIEHLESTTSKGLQVADMFCWGIFRKYERREDSWYRLFEGKVRFENLYLLDKKK